MSKIICGSAIDGAVAWVARAEARLDEAIAAKGEACPVAFPGTAYSLPVIYSFTGSRVETLGDMRPVLRQAKGLLPERPSEQVWLPYLGNALEAGVAALFACEIIEACKTVMGPPPVDGIWLGAANDVIMRERGIEFVDGTAPGFAAVTGAAPSNEIAVAIARELQQKNLYVFMGGPSDGRQFAEQLAEEGVQLGWETRLVPFGRDVSALIYALGFANRAALSFGGVKPGDFAANLRYNKERIFAFVLTFGEVTPDKYAVAAGAINYGFPVIADTDIPQILPTGVCTYEHVVSNVPHETMVERALEVRGCKVRITKVPVPVPYGPAFEGERIRKADVQVEFGGNRTPAFEFVTAVELDQIDDGEITLIGPDIDAVAPGTALPLAIWVEVAGRKMQSDFEPILERQIHHLVNSAEGIWHMGQRDIVWTRVSKNGFARGLRLRHYGEILHAKLLSDYPAIVDKVRVTLITEREEVERRLAVARKVYDERNRRLESMTDESVDTFYSCLLCQSFAPNHVCIITPERLGLCGAYNWLDGKAAYEIDETGPNQPVRKGECIDPVRGVWRGINEYVYSNSHKTVKAFCAYSIMDQPMTSCGCFEVICAYVPECNGVMAVNREFQGDTPAGMTFSTLAGNVGGGQQTPGFMGCGKVFLTSRKFLLAEGGHRRLVWMPRELKELLRDDLRQRFEEQGVPDLMDRIADETVATEAADVRAYLETSHHPALTMDDMAALVALDTTPGETPRSAPAAAEREATPAAPDGPPGAGTPSLPPPADDGRAGGGRRQPPAVAPTAPAAAATAGTEEEDMQLTPEMLEEIKSQVTADVLRSLRQSVTREVVRDIITTLSRRFLGTEPEIPEAPPTAPETVTPPPIEPPETPPALEPVPEAPSARERLGAIKSFAIARETADTHVWEVTLGATREQGGSRGRTLRVGGAGAMPFHLWEGDMPNRPLVAMEVFDSVSDKYPAVLREIYGELLQDPAQMAVACVHRFGADLISVRLEGTHPEKGNRSPQDAVRLVRAVLEAVDVPLIVTGHSHFDSNNEVLKAVAQACEGENLLLNWVEQDNYRTIAGAALAYGHSLVAQSPIDVNIAKQLNILLTNMDVKPTQIVMDPMTGSLGYGLEYTYSVMERIRLTALGGDRMLAGPMLVNPGPECVKTKEYKALERDFPAWGELAERASLWELATAVNLLYAGADILVMDHPEAAVAAKQTIVRLMD
ncbi:MAG: CO dehydrogenase/CO-methylating acetyl-CoA synthase complex subunit beta, partial [Lentisphaeria bacterium]|nr:CO dehydrogenase/CO-methylating acetyl-CoA synthase complex subunit beta [Lentisphaeria bacterium]